jgi:arginine deiminase
LQNIGCQNMVDPIRRILIKHPRQAYRDEANLAAQWQALNYLGLPDFAKAIADYDHFVELLESSGMEIHFLPENTTTTLDSIYTHDPCVVSNKGAILCTMGKTERLPEPEAMATFFEEIGVPVLGRIEAPGTLEGGDVVWIDERTVAVGEGYRTNAEGIRQFGELLGDLVDEVISVPLPHWTGSGDCLHLMSNVSPLDHDLHLVYSRLLTVPFRQFLLGRGITLVEVPDEEYDSMGCNVLAVAPRKVILLTGNPETRRRLEAEGVEVQTYDGSEISLKGSGGPTCLTRPLQRCA